MSYFFAHCRRLLSSSSAHRATQWSSVQSFLCIVFGRASRVIVAMRDQGVVE